MGKANADLLCEMLASRGELLKQLKGLREDRAFIRPEPEEWSVLEILQHEADVDLLQVRRFGEILSGKEMLSGRDPAEWEGPRSAAEKDGLPGVLNRFYAARAEVLEAVSNLDPADFDKSGKHPARGPISLLGLVKMVINHDLDHAQQIAKTRAVVEA